MESSFFDEGYTEKSELEEIEKRLLELRTELRHDDDYGTGRSDREVRSEMERLEKKKQEIHLMLERLEHEA